MVNVDKLGLNANKRHLPYRKNLEEFLNLVALAKPLCNFVVDSSCTLNEWVRSIDGTSEYEESINTIKVFEDGEAIGSISTATRYRGGSKVEVYGVESFRIYKERGDRNTTYAKDLKVAMRHVKKTFIARLDGEVVELIKSKTAEYMRILLNQTSSAVTWSMDSRQVGYDLAIAMYNAHKRGEPVASVPLKLASANMEDVFKKCAEVEQATKLHDHYRGNNGYGVMLKKDNSVVVYSLAADKLTKYSGFDELPINIQEKLAMFKVLDRGEAYENFGIQFDDELFFIP